MRARASTSVIAFPKARVRPAAGEARGPAEIVIFTGVRIERLPEVPEPRRRARAAARKSPRRAEADRY